jgi:hypothetical protein
LTTTLPNILEHSHFHTRRRENLNSQESLYFPSVDIISSKLYRVAVPQQNFAAAGLSFNKHADMEVSKCDTCRVVSENLQPRSHVSLKPYSRLYRNVEQFVFIFLPLMLLKESFIFVVYFKDFKNFLQYLIIFEE